MEKKVLITSALLYVNNVPHLGNIVGCVLPADVYARFNRLMGNETLYVGGTDEYGTATETKAKEEGVSPQELCDKYFDIQTKIFEWFNISFDCFGRTSKDPHGEIVQSLFNQVLENGMVEEKTMTQPYSLTEKKFLADRYVLGTCPHCQFDDARGDQCDNCGKLLDPKDLIDAKSTDGGAIEFRETNHLFISLDKLQPKVQKWFEEVSTTWSQTAIGITKGWLNEGLLPRAISRDLKWGVNIPAVGDRFSANYEDKVFYVWFDAPIGYISITAQGGKDWKTWWQGDDVELSQFMGKDNVPFHSIIFPSTLLASGQDYNLVNNLDATDYLNYEGGKFSKSRNRGVFGDDAMNSGIPSDVYRYTLMFNRPEGGDTQFTWKGLQERVNNELVANLGNFVNRTLSFIDRFLNKTIPEVSLNKLTPTGKKYFDLFKAEVEEYKNLVGNRKLRDGLIQLMKISSIGNQFFQEAAPWKSRTEDVDACNADLGLLANMVNDLSTLSEPYLPETAAAIRSQLGSVAETLSLVGVITVGGPINEPKVLFNKLEDKDIKDLQEKFAGKKMEETKQVETKEVKATDVALRVGKIIDISKHPKADKLYVEKIDFGDSQRQIVSGLVPFYTEEELLGKQVVIVHNLKPAKLRGEMSEGMLLAAENDDESVVGVIMANDAPLGSYLSLDGTSMNNADEITFDDFMKFKLETKAGKLLVDGQVLSVDEGELVADRGLDDAQVH